MSNIDKQALRKAAIAATGGKWVFSRSGANSNVQAPIELQKGGRALVVLCKLNNAGWSGQIQTENNAKFIAVANPETVLALLDELEAAEHTAAVDHEAACSLVEENEEMKRKLEAAEKRIAELEAREVKVLDGYVMVPIVPTEDMAINGFESEPDPHFSDEKEWAEYKALSGCRKAARRAELCWAAMIKAVPKQETL
ncbi:ead/Ea22-like family protein [Citrobacter sp. RHB35-C17]|uniref:ead/Ea22-like family protein n=1 Tax=Citrobacter sp. RHB35-C17 TaxID=2742625 RepID=UPI0015EAADC5|nr:ead/Ea22-like family protein [Citrobacter sp. RHB35-C17]QMD63092.1 ead/Ea22-like family protein [Citrobacter sp. RHB35-C17]